jgi:hypothetical protein
MIRKLISMGSVAIGASLNVDALHVANAVDGVMGVIRGKRIVRVALAMLFGGVLSASAAAQGAQTSAGANAGTTTKVAVQAEITVSGTIQQVITDRPEGSPVGLHLLVQSAMGMVDASVGPNLSKDVLAKLTTGQAIKVTGTIQVFNGQNYMLARLLVVDDQTVTVRNQHGFLVHTTAGSRTHQNALAKTNGGAQ